LEKKKKMAAVPTTTSALLASFLASASLTLEDAVVLPLDLIKEAAVALAHGPVEVAQLAAELIRLRPKAERDPAQVIADQQEKVDLRSRDKWRLMEETLEQERKSVFSAGCADLQAMLLHLAKARALTAKEKKLQTPNLPLLSTCSMEGQGGNKMFIPTLRVHHR
jgi:hypothetical protein